MSQHVLMPAGPAYGLMMAAGILIGAVYWHRRVKGNPDLLLIYIGALCGAFLGAKLAYLLAEGWLDIGQPNLWLRWATGKSVLGGLLGGYAGVEWTKKLVGHRASTGDAFALVLPVGLFLGRIGCHLHGCCQGSPVGAAIFRC
jgi:phosphatidylglycerol---prolipoprotein diacylglyceryl transferase